MGDGYVQLRSHQRARQRRVGVAVDDQPVGAVVERDRLDAREHGGRLRAMGTGTHLEVAVRRRDRELAEEQVRHRVVVVLAGVQQKLLMLPAQHARHRRSLDELRPRAYYREHLHGVRRRRCIHFSNLSRLSPMSDIHMSSHPCCETRTFETPAIRLR